MSVEPIEVLVVGAGQAGIAASEHLSQAGIPHLVLEADRIAEKWRTGRWDGLVANGPAWHDRFPGLEFSGDPQGFPGKEAVADYFVDYAAKIAAPIRCGVTVTDVRRNPDGPGFSVQTSAGIIAAQYVIAATGPFQRPVMPAMVPATDKIMQIHSAAYRNPDQLPKAGFWWWGRDRLARRLRRSCLRQGAKLPFRWARMAARRADTAGAILSGGWGF